MEAEEPDKVDLNVLFPGKTVTDVQERTLGKIVNPLKNYYWKLSKHTWKIVSAHGILFDHEMNINCIK